MQPVNCIHNAWLLFLFSNRSVNTLNLIAGHSFFFPSCLCIFHFGVSKIKLLRWVNSWKINPSTDLSQDRCVNMAGFPPPHSSNGWENLSLILKKKTGGKEPSTKTHQLGWAFFATTPSFELWPLWRSCNLWLVGVTIPVGLWGNTSAESKPLLLESSLEHKI